MDCGVSKKWALWVVIAMSVSCSSAPEPEGDDWVEDTTAKQFEELSVEAERPRFSPDGQSVVFHAGDRGQRNIYAMDLGEGQPTALTQSEADDRDPTWGPDGRHVVFASDREGGYDLYRVDIEDKTPVVIVDDDADLVEPAVSPLRYAFFAVAEDGCAADSAFVRQVDGYEKVAYTRRSDDAEEVWFASLEPGGLDEVRARGKLEWVGDNLEEVSGHGEHEERLSPRDQHCSQPQFAHDGLAMTWSCDDGSRTRVSFDNEARWDQDFMVALEAVGLGENDLCRPGSDEYDWDRCLDELPRRYTRYEGPEISAPEDDIQRASISANHIMITGDADGQAVYRDRFGDEQWHRIADRLEDDGYDGVQNVTWSPDGSRIAFDYDDGEGRRLATVDPGFYLQDVRNLDQFAELFDEGRSQRLAEHGFVARPGTEREFYALYEKLRYEERPQFVTADAALQVFRDEFLDILERAEEKMAERLRKWSAQMAQRYVEVYEGEPSDSHYYLAVYFATGSALLEAADRVETPDPHDYMGGRVDDELEEPVAKRMDEKIGDVLEDWPVTVDGTGGQRRSFRSDIGDNLEVILAHEGTERVDIPGFERPVVVDWSQFRPRGPYAENELAGYFMAMNWFQQLPLPFDEALVELLEQLESVEVGGESAMEVWESIDEFVAGFMGRPADGTIRHLDDIVDEQPQLADPFDESGLRQALDATIGEVGIRDASTALETGTKPQEVEAMVSVRAFPSRAGLDSTFFTELTHPNIDQRGMVSSLDALAALGSERAEIHGAQNVADEQRDEYLEILETLRGETPSLDDDGYWNTDVYYSWLAAVATLARSEDVPEDSLMEFAHSDAWRDRLLSSSLAGYAQLKHAGVLYAQQSMAVECASDNPFLVLVEQPILPPPHGFVDPVPSFFKGLKAVAEQTYEVFDYEPAPGMGSMGESAHVADFVGQLATLSQKQIDGEPLTDQQLRWIEYVGRDLEELTMNTLMEPRFSVGGDSRDERGIVMTTDIHTNLFTAKVRQLGVGRILDMYVAVPDGVGRTMTQGGIFSFYEFTHPMDERLTDEEWHQQIERNELPELPSWTSSFVEEGP